LAEGAAGLLPPQSDAVGSAARITPSVGMTEGTVRQDALGKRGGNAKGEASMESQTRRPAASQVAGAVASCCAEGAASTRGNRRPRLRGRIRGARAVPATSSASLSFSGVQQAGRRSTSREEVARSRSERGEGASPACAYSWRVPVKMGLSRAEIDEAAWIGIGLAGSPR